MSCDITQGQTFDVGFWLSNSSSPTTGLPGQSFATTDIQIWKSSTAGWANADAAAQAAVVDGGLGGYKYTMTGAETTLGLTNGQRGFIMFKVNKVGAVPNDVLLFSVGVAGPGELLSTSVTAIRDSVIAGLASSFSGITTMVDALPTLAEMQAAFPSLAQIQGGLPTLAAIADAVPTLAEITGVIPTVNDISAVVPTVAQIRDGILNFAHDGNRTVRGTISRIEASLTGRASGLKDTGTAIFYLADAVTEAFRAAIDVAVGTRAAAVIPDGDE